jgi:sugar/nucleoside kinase (ribokinase family)
MPTTLITPMANDDDAKTLRRKLELEDINRDYLAEALPSDSRTISPRVYILRTPTEEVYCAFKNEHQLPLRGEFLRATAVAGLVASSDIVFVTFEVTQSALHQLTTGLIAQDSPALLVVTASPVRDDIRLDRTILSRIDLLVGSDDELLQLSDRRAINDVVATLHRLINDGVRTAVALCSNDIVAMCRGRSEATRIPYPDTTNFDTAGARDAFAVSLAHRLQSSGERLRESDLEWASMAYSLAAGKFGDADSMPTFAEVSERARHFGMTAP